MLKIVCRTHLFVFWSVCC